MISNAATDVIKRLRYSRRAFIFVLAAVFAAISLPVIWPNPAVTAQNKPLVTIHADNLSVSFMTDAPTVAEALNRANISIGEHDLVEPAAGTPIGDESFNINVYRARPVTVIDGGERSFVMSPYQSPKLIAEHAGFFVYPEDRYQLSRVNDFIATGSIGLELTIERATPVKLNLYGQKTLIRTHAQTVGELALELNLQLDETHFTRPGAETPISPNLDVAVVQTGSDRVVEEQTVAFSERVINDSSVPLGERRVVTPGVPGIKLVTYQVEYENDEIVTKTKVDEVVVEEPLEQVVVLGTKAPKISGTKADWLAASNIPAADWGYASDIISRESGWCPTKWNGQWGYCPETYSAMPGFSSGAYGLCQALPATKMSSAGSDYMINPVTQLNWCHDYALVRYGSWARAYNFWQNNKWW